MCAADILPEGLASSAKYEQRITAIQQMCDELAQEAQREREEALVANAGVQPPAAVEVSMEWNDAAELDNLMGELDELEPEAKRVRIQQLVERSADRARPTRLPRTSPGRAQPPAGRERSRSPVGGAIAPTASSVDAASGAPPGRGAAPAPVLP